MHVLDREQLTMRLESSLFALGIKIKVLSIHHLPCHHSLTGVVRTLGSILLSKCIALGL